MHIFMHRDTFTHRKLFTISIWAHAKNFVDFGLFTSASDHDFNTFSFLLFAASFDAIFCDITGFSKLYLKAIGFFKYK